MASFDADHLKAKILEVMGSQAAGAERFAETFIRLAGETNEFHETAALIQWVADLRASETMKVEKRAVSELLHWKATPTGEIVHESGGFYEIVGVHVSGADREVDSWDQPLVAQHQMGVLGIATTLHNGVRYYLLQGKAEPGNYGLIQVSPTLQATFANLQQLHHGKKPPFFDLFTDDAPVRTIYKKWLAEDGGRFLDKTNLNILIDVDGLISRELPRNFRWFTLRQIKEMLDHDNLIGPHVRSIISHL